MTNQGVIEVQPLDAYEMLARQATSCHPGMLPLLTRDFKRTPHRKGRQYYPVGHSSDTYHICWSCGALHYWDRGHDDWVLIAESPILQQQIIHEIRTGVTSGLVRTYTAHGKGVDEAVGEMIWEE